MEPGAVSDRHSHPRAEQIWLIEQGEGVLLLAGDTTEALRTGDVVRTPAGAIHGVANSGAETLIYLAVTAPPQDFTFAYAGIAPVAD